MVHMINPRAGQPALPSDLVNVPKLITAYYANKPDPSIPEQRVAFGTSGHRGSAFDSAFNEWHILAITQAICDYRRQQQIDGPLFIGIDTHALSEPALASALEVLAANGVTVMLADGCVYTPTPVISHAILTYNHGRAAGLADGIVVTPSHNPPDDGGFKYNPPHGGPAGKEITSVVEAAANGFIKNDLAGVRRIGYQAALKASTTHLHDYRTAYIADLQNVIDMESIRGANLTLGVDPLGGAGVEYWAPITDLYKLNLKVVNTAVDPTFRFMTLDWDGKIRMDCSSPYAMRSLIDLIGSNEQFDVAFGCDTDHDRHGIVARNAGLLPPNHYLSVCVAYLFAHRPQWGAHVGVGKTLVSSSMIDRVAKKLGRALYEVPVGFKWFVDGLRDGSLGFVGEESAGASLLRRDGSVWTTDKDGIALALLSAEMTARTGSNPAQAYAQLTKELGDPVYGRVDAPATREQKAILERLSPKDVHATELAGQPIRQVLTAAPGDGAKIGGIKVTTDDGWFAARPSGTEEIYKIYSESFLGEDHLRLIQKEAQAIVTQALSQPA
jgi:phosphoglucomutase